MQQKRSNLESDVVTKGELNQEQIISKVTKRPLNWYGHVQEKIHPGHKGLEENKQVDIV